MKQPNAKILAFFGMFTALAGCGGGGGTDGGSNTEPVMATVAPKFPGVFNGDGLNVSNNAANSCPTVLTADAPQNVPFGKDVLLVSSQNIGYRVCGYRLWSGPITGTVSFNTKNPNTPGSGDGKISIDYYLQPGTPKSQTAVLSGNIVANSSGDASATSLAFSDTSKNTFNFSRIVPSASKVITTSYATFAGSYRQVDWTLLGSTTMRLNDKVSVSSSGAVTATTQLGTMAGRIVNFDAVNGVHDIEMTVTPTSGQAYKMVGVIGPGPTTSGDAKDFSNVTVALTGNNQFYASVFTR